MEVKRQVNKQIGAELATDCQTWARRLLTEVKPEPRSGIKSINARKLKIIPGEPSTDEDSKTRSPPRTKRQEDLENFTQTFLAEKVKRVIINHRTSINCSATIVIWLKAESGSILEPLCKVFYAKPQARAQQTGQTGWHEFESVLTRICAIKEIPMRQIGIPLRILDTIESYVPRSGN